MENKFGWNAKKEAALIDAIRVHPALWNSKDKNFPKNTLKKVLYESIAKELNEKFPSSNFNYVICMAKFQSMRSYFFKELKKIKNILNIGNLNRTSIVSLSKWVHFSQLFFLTARQSCTVKSEPMSPLNEELQQSGDESPHPELSTCTVQIESPRTVAPQDSASDFSKLMETDDWDQSEDESSHAEPSTSTSQAEESPKPVISQEPIQHPATAFAKFVEVWLRQLPQDKMKAKMLKMTQILMEED